MIFVLLQTKEASLLILATRIGVCSNKLPGTACSIQVVHPFHNQSNAVLWKLFPMQSLQATVHINDPTVIGRIRHIERYHVYVYQLTCS